MKSIKQQSAANGPDLPLPDQCEETLTAVHMWSQIVGKIRLELSPWINYSWGSTLYITSNGLSTSAIPYGSNNFEIRFNFIEHKLEISVSNGAERSFSLSSMFVADFYAKTMELLKKLEIEVDIYAKLVEVVTAIPFSSDTEKRDYDADAVHRFWQALIQINKVFTTFRAGFIGKVSPVHFFWGAFDLAVTRFSGRMAPKHPGGVPNCADWVMEEAYSHELSSAGFWAGAGLGEPAFYSYAYAAPDGFGSAKVKPDAAYFHEKLGEFILPYRAVKSAKDPAAILIDFLQSTYEAAADLGKWDRHALEKK